MAEKTVIESTEPIVTQESSRAQIITDSTPSDSGSTETATEAVSTTETENAEPEAGATEGTERKTEEPEFKDPNMQTKFTQKMQELSVQKKQYEESLKKAGYYEALKKDEGALKVLKDYYSGQQNTNKPKVSISQDDILNGLENAEQFQAMIEKIADARAEEKLAEIRTETNSSREQLREMAFMQDIEEFSNAKDDNGNLLHPDYEELEKTGKIEEYLPLVSKSLPSVQKIELAYRLAKAENQEREITEKAHRVVEQKKKSIGERGNSTSSTVVPKFNNRTEFVAWQAKQLGLNEIP